MNGPYTRYETNDPDNEEKKSAFDLVIVSKTLYKYVEKVEIDKDLKWTPCRPYKKSVKYGDHYAVLVSFLDIPKKRKARSATSKVPVIWNTNKEGGWEKYLAKTSNNKKLDELSIESDKVDEMMHQISKEINSLKYICFGKVSNVNKFEKEKKAIENLQKEKEGLASSDNYDDNNNKEEVNVNLGNALRTLNRRKFEDELESLKRTKGKKGKAAAIFNLQQRIIGGKKLPVEAIAIEDPSTKMLVSDTNKIKDISLDYCAKLLTNRKPNPGYEAIVEHKIKLHTERMNEYVENDIEELDRELFQKVLRDVGRKSKDKYKFILNGGTSSHNALYFLFRSAWKYEKIPETWYNSLL